MKPGERTAEYFRHLLAVNLDMYDCEVDPKTHTVSWPDHIHEALTPRATAAGMTVEELVETTLAAAMLDDNVA